MEEFSCLIKQTFNLSTDGSGNLKLKKYHKVHCNVSSEFIIMYVLTEMFYVQICKNRFGPNHGIQVILKEFFEFFSNNKNINIV